VYVIAAYPVWYEMRRPDEVKIFFCIPGIG
jgi:hypothetical protein